MVPVCFPERPFNENQYFESIFSKIFFTNCIVHENMNNNFSEELFHKNKKI